MKDVAVPILIRDIMAADTDALVALWIRAWTPTLPQIDFTAREPFIRTRLADFSAPPRHARVATSGEKQLGFALIDPRTSELEQIAVDPDCWGKGIARMLLEEAGRLCRAPLKLTVNKDNPRAVSFYRKYGFIETGEAISPYSGLPILSMERIASA